MKSDRLPPPQAEAPGDGWTHYFEPAPGVWASVTRRLERGAVERHLIGEELVVHRPELTLGLRRHCRLGGDAGVGMHRERQITEDEPNLITVELA